MTDYKQIFEKALSEACEKNDFSDDEKLFGIVKERTGTMEKRTFKWKKPAVTAAALAAAAALTVSVGAVANWDLAAFFTRYFNDSATQELADEGYFYSSENYAENNVPAASGTYPVMGETLEKDIFTAKILGIAGDTQDPMMLIDITVNDPEVAAASDVIGVYTQAIGTYEFENMREKYGKEFGKGVKDETDPSLFHVSVRVPPFWITQGEEVVFDIVSIHTLGLDGNDRGLSETDLAESGLPAKGNIVTSYHIDLESKAFGIPFDDVFSKVKAYNVGMQFRFTLPENILKEAPRKWYGLSDQLVFTADDTEFILMYSEFGAHSSYISLSCGIRENMEDYVKISGPEHARKFAEQFVLTADGVEYKPDIERAFTYRDTRADTNVMIENMCYLNLTFPPIDYENAQSVTLSANGVSYEIKP